MIFIVLLAAITLSIALSAAFFSVFGLAETFVYSFLSVTIMGASLEAGKLITASALYRLWDDINTLFKGFLIFLMMVLIILTSWGIYGYLVSSYQKESIDMKTITQQVELIDSQKLDLNKRLEHLNIEISKVPEKFVSKKIELIKQLNAEKSSIASQIETLDKTKLELTSKQLHTEARVGPVVFVAQALNITVDRAITYLVIIIMLVFDPLAISLTILFNIALKKYQKEKNNKTPESKSEELQPPSTEIDVINDINYFKNKDKKKADILKEIRNI